MLDGDDTWKEDLLPKTSDWPNGACNGPRYSTSLEYEEGHTQANKYLTSQYRWGEAKRDAPSQDILEEVE